MKVNHSSPPKIHKPASPPKPDKPSTAPQKSSPSPAPEKEKQTHEAIQARVEQQQQRVKEFRQTGSLPSIHEGPVSSGSLLRNKLESQLHSRLPSPRSRLPQQPSASPEAAPTTTAAPGTLHTENAHDTNVNCLDKANQLLQQDPALRENGQMVFLQDTQNTDGNNAGHLVIERPDGSYTDPNHPQQPTSMEQLREQGYVPVGANGQPVEDPSEVYRLPASDFAQAMEAPPAERGALLDQAGVPQNLRTMRLADGGTGTSTPPKPGGDDSSGIQGSGEVSVDLTAGTVTTTFKLETAPASLETPEGARIGGKIEGGPFANAEASLTLGRPDEQGRIPVNVTLTAEEGFALGAEVDTGSVSVGASSQSGHRESISYDLNLTPDQITAIQNGSAPLPNPADPSSIPPGGSIIATSENFESSSFNAAWHGIGLESKMESTEGTSFGVERLEDNPDVVRITTGPHEAVSQSLELGPSINLGDIELKATLGSDRSLVNRSSQSVDIDISTPEGEAAYQQFLQSGQLPQEAPPAVSNSQSIETISYSQDLHAGISAGPLQIGGQFWDVNSEMTIQRGPNGTTYTLTADAREDNNIEVSWRERPDGTTETIGATADLDNSTGGLNLLLGEAGIYPSDPSRVNLHVTPQGAERLQQTAVEAERARLAELTEWGNYQYTDFPEGSSERALLDPNSTPQEFYQAHMDIDRRNGLPSMDPITTTLLSAETSDQVVDYLVRDMFLDQNSYTYGDAFERYFAQNPALFSTPDLSLTPQ